MSLETYPSIANKTYNILDPYPLLGTNMGKFRKKHLYTEKTNNCD